MRNSFGLEEIPIKLFHILLVHAWEQLLRVSIHDGHKLISLALGQIFLQLLFCPFDVVLCELLQCLVHVFGREQFVGNFGQGVHDKVLFGNGKVEVGPLDQLLFEALIEVVDLAVMDSGPNSE